MGFWADFKKFAMRGNVVDLAVGVIIGAAFGTITKSLVDDVMMPPLGLLMGKVDFKEKFIPLDLTEYGTLKQDLLKQENEARKVRGEPPLPPDTKMYPSLEQVAKRGITVIRYGAFVNALINFVIVAFAVFLVVKAMMKMQKKEPTKPATAPELTTSEKLLAEIRDAVKAKPAK